MDANTEELRQAHDVLSEWYAENLPGVLESMPVERAMLDAGASLRDVQIVARHAGPKTTMRYDRARKNLDRHPNYIPAAYMASGT